MLFYSYIFIYYINLSLAISFSGVMCLSLGVSICFSNSASSVLLGVILEILVFFSVILLSIKSSITSAVFWITLFEIVLSEPVVDCLV